MRPDCRCRGGKEPGLFYRPDYVQERGAAAYGGRPSAAGTLCPHSVYDPVATVGLRASFLSPHELFRALAGQRKGRALRQDKLWRVCQTGVRLETAAALVQPRGQTTGRAPSGGRAWLSVLLQLPRVRIPAARTVSRAMVSGLFGSATKVTVA